MPVNAIDVDIYECRSRLDLQALERALIAVGDPLWLNSAKDGLQHEPDSSFFPPSNPITTPPTGGASVQLNVTIERLIRGSAEVWGQRSSRRIHPRALNAVADAALVRRTWHDNPHPVWVSASKDITVEEFEFRAPGIDYRGDNAGPGTTYANWSQAYAHGVVANDRDTRMLVNGPFLDLWALDLDHFEIILAILYLCRLIYWYRPLIVLCESQQVTAVFINLAEFYSAMPGDDEFFDGHTHVPNAEVKEHGKKFARMNKMTGPFLPWVGTMFIARTSPSTFAIVSSPFTGDGSSTTVTLPTSSSSWTRS